MTEIEQNDKLLNCIQAIIDALEPYEFETRYAAVSFIMSAERVELRSKYEITFDGIFSPPPDKKAII